MKPLSLLRVKLLRLVVELVMLLSRMHFVVFDSFSVLIVVQFGYQNQKDKALMKLGMWVSLGVVVVVEKAERNITRQQR